jgi:hypothetical protein
MLRMLLALALLLMLFDLSCLRSLENLELCRLCVGTYGSAPGTVSVVSPKRALGMVATIEGPLLRVGGGDCIDCAAEKLHPQSGDTGVGPAPRSDSGESGISVPVRLNSTERVLTVRGVFFSVLRHESISSSLIGVTPRFFILRWRHRPNKKKARVQRIKTIDPSTTERTMTSVCLLPASAMIGVGIPGGFGGLEGVAGEGGSITIEGSREAEGLTESSVELGTGSCDAGGGGSTAGVETNGACGDDGSDGIGTEVTRIGVLVVSRIGCAVNIGRVGSSVGEGVGEEVVVSGGGGGRGGDVELGDVEVGGSTVVEVVEIVVDVVVGGGCC